MFGDFVGTFFTPFGGDAGGLDFQRAVTSPVSRSARIRSGVAAKSSFAGSTHHTGGVALLALTDFYARVVQLKPMRYRRFQQITGFQHGGIDWVCLVAAGHLSV